jgi:hypothetical protein
MIKRKLYISDLALSSDGTFTAKDIFKKIDSLYPNIFGFETIANEFTRTHPRETIFNLCSHSFEGNVSEDALVSFANLMTYIFASDKKKGFFSRSRNTKSPKMVESKKLQKVLNLINCLDENEILKECSTEEASYFHAYQISLLKKISLEIRSVDDEAKILKASKTIAINSLLPRFGTAKKLIYHIESIKLCLEKIGMKPQNEKFERLKKQITKAH